MKLNDLVEYLDDLMQPELFKDYTPNGLQIAGKEEVKSVAVAVSASVATIQAAVEAGVDALLVHHGLFWRGENQRIVGPKREKIKLLLDHGISLIGYHLPLDAHKAVGNNWTAARALGWKEIESFEEIGVMGQRVASDAATFQQELERYYDHPAHYASGGSKHIETVALISGGAHKCIEAAAAAGADAFITGSFDEPIWHLAQELGVHFFAMGHSNTEEVGPKALGERVNEDLGLRQVFLRLPNPF